MTRALISSVVVCAVLLAAAAGHAERFLLGTDAGAIDVVPMAGGASFEPQVVAGTPFRLSSPEALTLSPPGAPYVVSPGPVLVEDFTWQLRVPFGVDALVVRVAFVGVGGTIDGSGFSWDRGRFDILRPKDPGDLEGPFKEAGSVPLAKDPLNFDFDSENGVGYPGTTAATGPMAGNFAFLGFAATIRSPDFTAIFEPLPEPGSRLTQACALAALGGFARLRRSPPRS